MNSWIWTWIIQKAPNALWKGEISIYIFSIWFGAAKSLNTYLKLEIKIKKSLETYLLKLLAKLCVRVENSKWLIGIRIRCRFLLFYRYWRFLDPVNYLNKRHKLCHEKLKLCIKAKNFAYSKSRINFWNKRLKF